MPSDVITHWLEHASFGAVFATVWLGLGAVTFGISTLIGMARRRPRPGYWAAPIAPGYPPRWVQPVSWTPILTRAAIATVCVMFLLIPAFLLLAFAGTSKTAPGQQTQRY